MADHTLQSLLAFHLTGERTGAGLAPLEEGLIPAALAPYREIEGRRHDYPILIAPPGSDNGLCRSLSEAVDSLLRRLAPEGAGGERLRRHAWRLEGEVRFLAAEGPGDLSTLLQTASANLLAANSQEGLADDFAALEQGWGEGGQVVPLFPGAPALLLAEAVAAAAGERRAQATGRLEALAHSLRSLLKADEMRSAAARSPERLEEMVGPGHSQAFDLSALSEVLTSEAPSPRLPEARRHRLEEALATISSHLPSPAAAAPPAQEVYSSCMAAEAALAAGLEEVVAVAKAAQVATLEVNNLFREHHTPHFARFSAANLTAEDTLLLPPCLVVMALGSLNAKERESLSSLLASNLPVRVLLVADDALGPPPGGGPAAGPFAPLTHMAVGAGAYVLQSPASNLPRLAPAIARGAAHQGPALFAVYASEGQHTLAPYLVAAAALEARACPAFAYDPAAGPTLAARFSVATNPEPEADWPTHSIASQDDALQRAAEEVAFTLVDFAALDNRYLEHFAVVPPHSWHEGMAPLAHCLQDGDGATPKVPYILMVDADDTLHRVVVTKALMATARRRLAAWHALREMGGVNNSHAQAALKEEHARLAEEAAAEAAAALPLAPEKAAPAAEPAGAPPLAPRGPITEPTIDTPRCTTCDECIKRNRKMFAYDANKHAYIADLSAGTYRQMVESAEACKVAIIHPGLPWNKAEPGLEELIARAAPFN